VADRKKILLIDDSTDLVEHVKDYLFYEGYVVQHELDGESGLATMETFLADVMIVDLVLPGISGLEVIRRARDRWEGLVIIAATGMLGDVIRAECLEAGAGHFLSKPYRLSALEELIRRQLQD
jgi:DNA-binding response OmpR family regulator